MPISSTVAVNIPFTAFIAPAWSGTGDIVVTTSPDMCLEITLPAATDVDYYEVYINEGSSPVYDPSHLIGYFEYSQNPIKARFWYDSDWFTFIKDVDYYIQVRGVNVIFGSIDANNTPTAIFIGTAVTMPTLTSTYLTLLTQIKGRLVSTFLDTDVPHDNIVVASDSLDLLVSYPAIEIVEKGFLETPQTGTKRATQFYVDIRCRDRGYDDGSSQDITISGLSPTYKHVLGMHEVCQNALKDWTPVAGMQLSFAEDNEIDITNLGGAYLLTKILEVKIEVKF